MSFPGARFRVLTFLAIIIVGGLLGLAVIWHLASAPYKGFSSGEVFVYIPKGTSVPQIGRMLHESGVVSHPRLFGWYVRLLHPTSSLKAGEYRFDRPLSLRAVATKLLKGEVYVVKVTVPEGYSRTEIVDLLMRNGIGTKERLLEATRDTKVISEMDRVATDLEGYLFPNTYFFSRRVPETEVVQTMVSGFLRIWTPERQKKARDLDMTLREVLTLASLIEKETALPSERPLVSAVFHNRLQQNIPLASDPTIIYGVKLVKDYDGVINRSDLRFDSPYNTYLYSGLPPGPIASPGLASIDAALEPAQVDYLFFVSRNDGSHLFTVDYSDHLRGVQQYQR